MELSATIERELEQRAGIEAAVEESEEGIVLTGLVETEALRAAALEIVADIAPEANVIDNLEVVAVLPEELDGVELSEADVGDFPPATPGTMDDESLEPGDFTDQQILHNAEGAAGPTGIAGIDQEYSEGDEVYVPPIDPVRRRNNDVLGGFSLSSMDDTDVPDSSLDGKPGDEAIADAVRRELEEDAATNGLEVRVSVRKGVVRLRGEVPTLEDEENAEEVAARVEGVIEVLDELEVTALG
jgi:osmotically-inducible protein OsmY